MHVFTFIDYIAGFQYQCADLAKSWHIQLED